MTTTLAKSGDIGDIGRITSHAEGWHRLPLVTASVAALTTLTDSSGLSGSHDDTIAAITNTDSLTDSTSGTADDTIDAVTLTDSSGGSADGTLEAIPAVNGSGATTAQEAAVNNNFAEVATELAQANNNFKEIADQLATQRTLNTVLAQNQSDIAQKVIELVTRDRGDDAWEIQGTDAANGSAAVQSDGSLLLTTDADSGDEQILAGRASQWIATINWQPQLLPAFRVQLQITDIADVIVWAGLKLTSTNVTATDADQAFLRFESGVNDGEIQLVTSVAGSDDAHDSGIAVALNDVIDYALIVDSARRPHHFVAVNGGPLREIEVGAAMTAAANLKPFIGVNTKTTAAATLRVWKPRLALAGQ